MAKREKKISKEEQTRSNLKNTLMNLRKDFGYGVLPTDPTPTRTYKVGDRVQIGYISSTFVAEVLDGGLIYRITGEHVREAHGKVVTSKYEDYQPWWDVLPYAGEPDYENRELSIDDRLRMTFMNSNVESLLHRFYRGVNMDPEYQRELVWDMDDKLLLISSIMNNIDIGKFALIIRDYSHDVYVEVLDGKQRLNAIREFYEDRFRYAGKLYSEMCFRDKAHFNDFPLVMLQVPEPKDRKDIYRYFVKLNTGGRPQDPSHIEKIRRMSEQ